MVVLRSIGHSPENTYEHTGSLDTSIGESPGCSVGVARVARLGDEFDGATGVS